MEKILNRKFRIAIVADSFPPDKTSAAVQLRDLAYQFARVGHTVSVLVPDHNLKSPHNVVVERGISIIRLKSPNIKVTNHILRAISEIFMPIFMLVNFLLCRSNKCKFDVVIWYSPSIFLGPFVHYLKIRNNCISYLILRDIFPEWAVDLGLIRRGGISYFVFKAFSNYQNRVADRIGIQTNGNIKYFERCSHEIKSKIEILHNWLGPSLSSQPAIDLEKTPLKGRTIFAYTGNMGVAQNMDLLVELALHCSVRQDLGFVFVGRGSEFKRLRSTVANHTADNILFYGELEPDQIPLLLAQCHFGMLSLSPKHMSHNIPGKFINYMREGLPCLALVNKNNDLVNFISDFNVGISCEEHTLEDILNALYMLVDPEHNYTQMVENARLAFEKNFSVAAISKQILNSMRLDDSEH